MNQTICRIYNILCRTVITLQFKYTASGILIFELQDIVDIGTTERIDTLCIIPYHTDAAMLLTKSLDYQVLRKVRVLILINQHELEETAVFLQHLRMVTEQDICLKQQIIEVHGTGLLATVLIPFIDFTQ